MAGTRERRRRLRMDSVNRLLPNALTMLGLCAGLTAMRYGMDGAWHIAVALIAVASLMDALDGRIARLMGGPTEFGGQLDSLTDAISFGVAPVALLYMWSLNAAGGVGWTITLLFSVCCVLRLARFNITRDDPDLPGWAGSFFSGVPAPAGAGLVLLPLVLSLQFQWDFLHAPQLTGPWVLIVAALMISRIPTYSFKRLRVRPGMVRFWMVGIAGFATVLITEPWATLSAMIIAYGLTIPFSLRSYRRREREEADGGGSDADAEVDGDEC